MAQDIYDPLNEYINVFHQRFREVAHTTFARLAEEAKVDVKGNRDTCSQLYDTEEAVAQLNSSVRWTTMLCVVLWIWVIGGSVFDYYKFTHPYTAEDSWTITLVAIGVVAAFVILLAYIHPKLSRMKDERDNEEMEAWELKRDAWKQMEPLNRLYDWDILTRMMSETVPRLEFDPYFTTKRLADMKKVYGWDDSFNEERSVVYSHSGLINGNPFVICRTRKMEMGEKTYYGHKTIYWTTEEEDSEGKTRTVHHSETLTASVTAPYPEYYEMTRLIYGNTAAPDLIFYREQSGLAGKEGSLAFKRAKRKLKKKARDLSNADFAMMTNEEFETIFNTSNRNNNQQFALLFTPLAQESMCSLLKDRSAGYGDDFDFEKDRMINIITSTHMQDLDLDMNPNQYRTFDYDKAENDFYEINAECFRAIYFALAPLLCIPLYQQIRPREAIYGRDMAQHSSFWEHEALANFWGQDKFMHPDCVTDCILKTEQHGSGDHSTITVYAHGHSVEEQVTYVEVYGGDGDYHDVPVYWDEYIPVVGEGSMEIKEDNSGGADTAASQTQRMEYINKVLSADNLKIYRRHIASKA